MKAISKYILRFLLGIVVLVMVVLLLVSLILFVPKVQEYVSHKASSFVSDKTGTRVEVGAIYFQFPNGVSVKELYVEDEYADTLLYAANLTVAIDYFALLHAEIEVSKILLENATANIQVRPDSSFNFDFIIDAFAGDSDKQEVKNDTASSGLTFDIGNIELNNVRFSYRSEPDGMYTFYSIGNLLLDVDQFDLDKQIYIASKVKLSKSKGHFEIFKSVPSTTSTDTAATRITVGAKNVSISETTFNFLDQSTETSFFTKVGLIKLKADPIDLSKQKIKVDNIQIDNTVVTVGINSSLSADSTSASNKPLAEDEHAKEKPWLMALDQLQLNNFNFSFDDAGEAKINKGVDYAHLDLDITKLESNQLYFNGINDLGLQLKSLSAKEQSGLSIQQAAFSLKMDSNSISTKDLILETPNTSISATAAIKYKSMEEIAEHLGQLQLDLQFKQTKIGLSDLLYFAPDLDTIQAIAPYLNQQLRLKGAITGAINEMDIQSFQINLMKSTSLKVDGQLHGLPNVEDLSFNFRQFELKTKREELLRLLPDNSIPIALQLPEAIQLNLAAMGNLKDFKTQLNLQSSYGNLSADLAFQQPKPKASSYQLHLELPQFDLASLLQDTTLGNFGFKGSIDGKGLSIEEMELNLDAVINDLEYQKYKYSDLNIIGTLREESFEGEVNMNDSNLIFDFKGKADLDSMKPSFDFTFNLEGIDLQRLNITENDYRINGTIAADFEGSNLEDLNGNLEVRDILIIYNGKQYRVDSLLFISIIDSGKTDISVRSNLMDAMFKGNIYLSDLGKTLKNHFSGRLSDDESTLVAKKQDFKFQLKIHDPDLLTEVIFPELNSFETGVISGEFDSEKDQLEVEVNFPKIDYLNMVVDSLRFAAKSDSTKLKASLFIKSLSYDSLSVTNIALFSTIKENEGVFNLQILDEFKEKMLQLKGSLRKKDSLLRFHFIENEQYLNAERWNVDPNNAIIFGKPFSFQDLNFSNDSQQIEINTREEFHDLQFSNFKLISIFNLISHGQKRLKRSSTPYEAFKQEKSEKATEDSTKEKKPPFLSGLLNGSVQLPLNSTSKLKGDLNIKNLQLSEVPLGDLKARYAQLKEKDSIKVSLKGNGNEVELNGYLANEIIDMKLDIQKVNMEVIEAFSNNQLKNTKGYLSASATFIKQKEEINAKGEIGFHKVRLRSTFLGETYFLNDEKISFSTDKIVFNNFTILDSTKHAFVTNGSVGISNLSNPTLDLKVKIDNFKFLNKHKETAKDLLYGKVLASADLKMRGHLNKPKINVELKLEKGTDITFIVPNNEADVIDREGVVEFVDKHNKMPELLSRDKTIDTLKIDFLGMDLAALIKINENAKLTIVIDPQTGDRLKIQGGGEIRADVDPTGRINMNGVYTIQKGDYELKLYNLVQRKFSLEKGSQLVWNGDPLEAKMDIKGVYVAKAAPLGLLGEQITNLSKEERNKYKKRIPFRVLLILGGQILKPDISFKIELPEDQKAKHEGAIATKLHMLNESESDLNRQVFSLIILKRFYSQSPTNAGDGGSYAARESVSQILTQQLNNLSDKYVKGINVELSVDSYSDYTSTGDAEGKTDVNLAVSKNLFNDRLEVRLDGDFNVEDKSQTSSSSRIAGDLSIEYKITEDGKYRLKLFRKDEYEGIIEGEFIETGVSLIYKKEFLKFRELFIRKNKTIESE